MPDNSGGISRQEALEILSLREEDLQQLLARTERLRRERFGDEVRLCAISNAKSGRCSERCDFCAQSASFDTEAPVFPIKSARQIADEALQAEAAGALEFSIVTSGRALRHGNELNQVEGAVQLIGEETRLERCASLGELPGDELDRLREAGLLRYHHNIETAPSFHDQIVHSHSYDDEVRVVTEARERGLMTCCGGILGMGETPEQRVEMALALRELEPDCVPLNFLDPRPGTPLAGLSRLTPPACLRIIAMFRLVLPDTPIFVCGGREANLLDQQQRIFAAGANGTMVGDYLTTSGQCAEEDRAMIKASGFRVEK